MSDWLTTKYHTNIELLVEREQRNVTCPVSVFMATGKQSQEAMFYILAITVMELALEEKINYDLLS